MGRIILRKKVSLCMLAAAMGWGCNRESHDDIREVALTVTVPSTNGRIVSAQAVVSDPAVIHQLLTCLHGFDEPNSQSAISAGWMSVIKMHLKYQSGRTRIIRTNLKYWNEYDRPDQVVNGNFRPIVASLMRKSGADAEVVAFLLGPDVHGVPMDY